MRVVNLVLLGLMGITFIAAEQSYAQNPEPPQYYRDLVLKIRKTGKFVIPMPDRGDLHFDYQLDWAAPKDPLPIVHDTPTFSPPSTSAISIQINAIEIEAVDTRFFRAGDVVAIKDKDSEEYARISEIDQKIIRLRTPVRKSFSAATLTFVGNDIFSAPSRLTTTAQKILKGTQSIHVVDAAKFFPGDSILLTQKATATSFAQSEVVLVESVDAHANTIGTSKAITRDFKETVLTLSKAVQFEGPKRLAPFYRIFFDRIFLKDGSTLHVGGQDLPLTCVFVSGQDNRFSGDHNPLFPQFILKVHFVANDFSCVGPINPGWPGSGGKKEAWDTYVHYSIKDPTIMLPVDAGLRYRWNEFEALLDTDLPESGEER